VIGRTITCCTIELTGKETLTPIKKYPDTVDMFIYLIVYCLIIYTTYQRIDECLERRKHDRIQANREKI
jgi:hypothetical protein